ncbi:phospholipase [Alkalihalobacillus alcalophilus ATCC 27647 = CGMCC 1.3604]|uniref:Phospholipase n=1 Tax=Alkalihalobacillus alcalophilus ATCC 27647 = CGMCC 1.3604 TaxID=1218173 RepID=A0A094WRY2_ALKAL|nr:alpha/beta hydrolase [Alkalihalobacillus alcalophilus]KGA98778.1 phospholipase [Alkalihalobacillus alcalophilus ATCC 27647 = CGMCC 1.3604]MED1560959.1 alpha/beta hydrolase [Alkalihalobacillus alcalophilus]THG90502.1 phospholipase [Alkalihalobacillus alcalophilus ATCC 27647 = CGMCC 1.3604]
MWTYFIEDSRATIVIVHGAGEHHGRYEWLANKWNEHGINVVMGDLPGQGRTRGKRGHINSFSQYLDSVDEWVKEAEKQEVPVYLLGHSMGGLVAIRYMMEKKNNIIKGLMLSSPCLGLYKPPSQGREMMSKALHRVSPSLTVNSGINSSLVTRNEEIRELYMRDELRVSKVSVRWYRELSKAMHLAIRYPEKMPDIPLVVMQAGDDKIVSKYAVKDWFDSLDIAEKAYKEWNGFYHEVFNEPEREDVFRYAVGFMNLWED